MSAAKGSKKKRANQLAAAPIPARAPSASAAPSAASVPVADAEVASPALIDSDNPRRRAIGRIVLVIAWLYVAAIWLLALDQTFGWGIFGPKVTE